jgi:hypothetical protein
MLVRHIATATKVAAGRVEEIVIGYIAWQLFGNSVCTSHLEIDTANAAVL